MSRLILLGRGPSKGECTFNYETWATATLLLDPEWRDKPYSKLFMVDWKPENLVMEVLRIAKERNIPVVSPHSHRIAGTESYPVFDVIEHFNANYLRNTASYMLALALYQGYEKLYIYGLDVNGDVDYLVNRSYITFWLGVATGMKVPYKLGGESLDWMYASGKAKNKYMT